MGEERQTDKQKTEAEGSDNGRKPSRRSLQLGRGAKRSGEEGKTLRFD